MTMKHVVREMQWPEFGTAEPPAPPAIEELRGRLSAARDAMVRCGFTHLVVYGDREHFANILYLSGLDPRFEEALLVVGPDPKPLLLVGNECEGYLTVSQLYRDGFLRHERYPTFSLLDQPRAGSRKLRDIFGGEKIGLRSRVGCVGWKYFSEQEVRMPSHAIDIPSYIADTLRSLAGPEMVLNATDLFMHPDRGFRATCSAAEIAFLEYSGAAASDGFKAMMLGLKEGMVDFDVCRLMGYNGLPLCCHPTFVTGVTRDRGLSGPVGAVLKRGEPFAANLGYWGSNTCRAGWLAGEEKDLPADARDYVPAFAGPYFEAMGEWFRLLRIGTTGDALYHAVQDRLPFDKFGIFLNPGHLIHWDEWLSAPVYAGSTIRLKSGMAIQSDVIPSSKTYFSTRLEDGFALADVSLRGELERRYPACMNRCRARRRFMIDTLGFELSEEVLPLSNMCGIVTPFHLRPERILTLQ